MNHGVTDVSKAFLEEQLFIWRHLLQLSVREGAVVQERILFVNDVESADQPRANIHVNNSCTAHMENVKIILFPCYAHIFA